MSSASLICEKLIRLQGSIAEAASRASRSPDEIQLIAVSKTYAVAQIKEVIEEGHCVFAENRVAEAVSKIGDLQKHTKIPDLEWHLIGHLQKNKVRFCPEHFHWIHSLDSLALAKKLEQCYQSRTEENHKGLKVLIQMNLSGEKTKHGVKTYDEALEIAEFLKKNTHLHLRGLMTIGKQGACEQDTRKIFSTLRNHCETLRKELADPEVRELSMGMSSDYSWAIAEGATMLRIGSALFGKRPLSQS